MKYAFIIFHFVLTGITFSQPDRYVILDTTQAKVMMHQCSRWTPNIQDAWMPTKDEIQTLEDTLESLSELSSQACCSPGSNVKNPKEFRRQYVGIVIDGKKYIYINAFPLTEFDRYPPKVKRPDWHKEPFRMCDGGSYYWGVLYDPANRSFSHLALNGDA